MGNEELERLFDKLMAMDIDTRSEALKQLTDTELECLIVYMNTRRSEKDEDYSGGYFDGPKVLRPYPSHSERLGRALSESLGASALEMRERLHQRQLARYEEEQPMSHSHRHG